MSLPAIINVIMTLFAGGRLTPVELLLADCIVSFILFSKLFSSQSETSRDIFPLVLGRADKSILPFAWHGVECMASHSSLTGNIL